MKLCPFCAEAIQDAAVKCRFCGEFLKEAEAIPLESGRPALAWYFKTPFILLVIGTIGPLGLPLIWLHPGLSRRMKWVWSLLTIIITALLIKASIEALQMLNEVYSDLLEGY
jgi:hypothetical protein